MKKIQAWVYYKTEVFIDVDDDATEGKIKELAEEEADDQWATSSEVSEIEYFEL